jgi:hypothetical protein
MRATRFAVDFTSAFTAALKAMLDRTHVLERNINQGQPSSQMPNGMI